MTNVEAVERLNRIIDSYDLHVFDVQALTLAIDALESQTEVNIYDKEETYHGCTVQVLTNTVTGQTSVGWWQE